MLYIFALYLPAYVALVFTFSLLIRSGKSKVQKFFTGLVVCCLVYFMIDPNFMVEKSDYTVLYYVDAFADLVSLCLPPMLYAFIRTLKGHPVRPAVFAPMFIPAVVVFSVAMMVYLMLGPEETAAYFSVYKAFGPTQHVYNGGVYAYHYWICKIGYNAILAAECAAVLIYIVGTLVRNGFWIKQFAETLSGKKETTPFNIICFLCMIFLVLCIVRVGLGSQYLIAHKLVSALLSIALAAVMDAICFICLYCSTTAVSWAAIRRVGSPVDMDHFLESKLDVLAPESEENNSYGELKTLFIKYIAESEPFLDPNLTIETVAAALHTNRTYISILVNQYFKQSFRDYINTLRVERAKKIMAENPDEILDTIASRSGFLSSSQLSRKFKEIEGITPRSWEQSLNRQNDK